MIRVRPFALLTAALCLALACSEQAAAPKRKNVKATGNETVRGKVTYQGKAVPYGFVQFFNDASRDRKTGLSTPISVGMIAEDGSYEITHVPTGNFNVTIVANPDVEPATMLRPALQGEDPSEPPIRGKRPPVRRPLSEDGPPETANLTAAQKKALREIHGKYGTLGLSNLSYTVQPGGQTYNIELK